MFLLIDGYNLLNNSDIFVATGPPTFERNRQALLDEVANLLTTKERERTQIVFDARMAPPGMVRQFEWRQIEVAFAPRNLEADDEIERLIAEHPAPRNLTVVSSDHRLQRAANRRGANAVDSDVWLKEKRRLAAGRANEPTIKDDDIDDTPSELKDINTQQWLKLLGFDDD